MTRCDDYVSHMRIKVADLKANLSRHLRNLRKSGEPIEVCVREEPVAYLTSTSGEPPDPKASRLEGELVEKLKAAGLVLVTRGPAQPTPIPIKTSRAGDGRTDLATVKAMRAAKDW